MNIKINWNNDNSIRKLFSYQTKIGLAFKFGTISISWYQAQQCNANKYLLELCEKNNCFHEIRKKDIYIQAKTKNNKWINLETINNAFSKIDLITRGK